MRNTKLIVAVFSAVLALSASAASMLNSYRFGSFPLNLGAETWLRADSLALADGDAVDSWADAASMGLVFRSSGTARPTFQTSEVNGRSVLRFDGSDDYMQTTVPTPSWEVPGGFTCTGVAAAPDGSLYVGDFDTGDIVRMHRDGRFIERIDTAIPVNAIQGVAYDTSDGTLWACDVVNSQLHHLNADGSSINTYSVGYIINGVAYDANDDSLWTLQQGSNSIRKYDAATVTLQTTLTASLSNPDGIVVESATRLLVTQDGASFNASAILRINNSTGATVNTISVAALDNIEHLAINPVDGYIYLAVDDLYHSSLAQGNRVYRLDAAGAYMGALRNVAGVTMVCVRKCLVNPTANRTLALWSVGTDAATARASLLVGLTSGKPVLGGRRLDADTLATVTAAAGVSTSAFEIQTSVIDYANSNATLYINGAADGSTTSFLTDGNTSNTAALAMRIASGNLTTFANVDIAEVIVIPRVLTVDELAYLHRELGAYYGITVP